MKCRHSTTSETTVRSLFQNNISAVPLSTFPIRSCSAVPILFDVKWKLMSFAKIRKKWKERNAWVGYTFPVWLESGRVASLPQPRLRTINCVPSPTTIDIVTCLSSQFIQNDAFWPWWMFELFQEALRTRCRHWRSTRFCVSPFDVISHHQWFACFKQHNQ